MKREHWLLVGAGSIGALVLLARRRDSSGSAMLGSPIEARGIPTVTPHGYFGAPRAGPPKHSHQGVDLAAPPGSHVLAVGDGVIVKTDPGLGKIVRKLRLDKPAAWDLSHRRVDAIVYADLGPPLVKPGDRVRRGDPSRSSTKQVSCTSQSRNCTARARSSSIRRKPDSSIASHRRTAPSRSRSRHSTGAPHDEETERPAAAASRGHVARCRVRNLYAGRLEDDRDGGARFAAAGRGVWRIGSC